MHGIPAHEVIAPASCDTDSAGPFVTGAGVPQWLAAAGRA